MTITTTILEDTADHTTTQVVDDVQKTRTITTAYKPGSPGFNQQALATSAANAIATLNTAESLLLPGGSAWDTATASQRSALMLGLVRDVRALIRMTLGLLDQPS